MNGEQEFNFLKLTRTSFIKPWVGIDIWLILNLSITLMDVSFSYGISRKG